MDKKLKVLVLASEPWRMDDGGGNTLNNFLAGIPAEYQQIYCTDLMPQNKVCSKYYQITDAMVIKNFLKRKPIVGRVFEQQNILYVREKEDKKEEKTNILLKALKRVRLNVFITARNFIWRYSYWKTQELQAFISSFNPDVIYAPCYSSPFQLALTRYVKELTGKKVVTWSADDNYSLRHFSFSPFFWINRLWNRACLRETYPYYDAFYSISEDEILEISDEYKVPYNST